MISTTITTYNRIDYTKKTINSYLLTTKEKHELIVVDNASTDGTREYLRQEYKDKRIDKLILNEDNFFPGKATNQGFAIASEKADYLHRSDNDLLYQKGWDTEALQAFVDFPMMGQLGLINEMYQLPPSERKEYEDKVIKKGKSVLLSPVNPTGNVGGPAIFPRSVYERGLKYEEDEWIGHINEDVKVSDQIKKMGYEVYALFSFNVLHMGYGDIEKYYEYYFHTYSRRNQLDWLSFRLLLEKRGKIKDFQTID